jgi:hypothetical protein
LENHHFYKKSRKNFYDLLHDKEYCLKSDAFKLEYRENFLEKNEINVFSDYT